jgi:hypothetical protein
MARRRIGKNARIWVVTTALHVPVLEVTQVSGITRYIDLLLALEACRIQFEGTALDLYDLYNCVPPYALETMLLSCTIDMDGAVNLRQD